MAIGTTIGVLARNRLVRVLMALILLGGVFVAGIVWSSLENVEQRRNFVSAIDQAARLSAKNAELRSENAAYQKRIADFERQLQVNQIAYDNLTKQLGESAEYINNLREDIDFYQSILSPQDNKAGVRIQSLRIQTHGNGHRYQMTVVQSLKHESSVDGTASIRIQGEHAGQPTSLDLADFGDAPGELGFRYFQVLEGEFKLPEEFRPRELAVTVVTRKSGKSKTTETSKIFDWP